MRVLVFETSGFIIDFESNLKEVAWSISYFFLFGVLLFSGFGSGSLGSWVLGFYLPFFSFAYKLLLLRKQQF